MSSLIEDLRHKDAYSSRPSRIDFVQTHISWVFLLDDEVFKIKRPVSLGFLDFSSLEQRRAACQAEVRLNDRLAPGIYLGVEPVRLASDGRHRLFADGRVVDWAVHMIRLPDRERADVRLKSKRFSAADVERVAAVLSRFHERTRCDSATAAFGTVEVIGRNVLENFTQTADASDAFIPPREADEIRAYQLEFLQKNASRFEVRAKMGRVRDGHGDLRLEHVYLRANGELAILDCIEFNERFRFADVCADLAFLSMDLADHDAPELSELLLAYYARESGDYDLFALVDFYQSYRAFIRGKISAMLARDPSADVEARERAALEARRFFLLALSAARAPLRRPVLVAVGGVIASGKSTIAAALGREMAAAVIESDRTRKQLVGVAPTEPIRDRVWQGSYAPEMTEKVYAEILRRAEVVLASGRSAILDASFRSRSSRQQLRDLAARYQVPLRMIEARCPKELCRRRLERRARESGVSDGRVEIFDDIYASFEPMTELETDELLVINTDRPVDVNALRSRVEAG